MLVLTSDDRTCHDIETHYFYSYNLHLIKTPHKYRWKEELNEALSTSLMVGHFVVSEIILKRGLDDDQT